MRILYAFAHPRTKGRALSFQDLMDKTPIPGTKEKMQRNRVHGVLKRLIQKGDVAEYNREEWKRGKRKSFGLTDRGITRITRSVTDNLKDQIEILHQFGNDSPVKIEWMDEAIANAESDGFKQVLQAIRDYGKDKIQVPYKWPRKRPPPPSPKELAERRRRREDFIRKAKT